MYRLLLALSPSWAVALYGAPLTASTANAEPTMFLTFFFTTLLLQFLILPGTIEYISWSTFTGFKPVFSKSIKRASQVVYDPLTSLVLMFSTISKSNNICTSACLATLFKAFPASSLGTSNSINGSGILNFPDFPDFPASASLAITVNAIKTATIN